MKRTKLLFAGCLSAGLLITQLAQAQETQVSTETNDTTSIEFKEPVQIKIDDQPIKVEAPGYACPSLADMNGDGLKDLLVGQFAGGKIKVYHADGEQGFKKGEWLKADGETAEVPGVW